MNFKIAIISISFFGTFIGSSTVLAQISACDFDYKKILTIDANEVSGSVDHTNFPILVLLSSDTDLVSNVSNSNGYDILFYLDDGTQLDHELELYNSSTGELIAWVNVTSLDVSNDMNIHMMYGNSSISADQSVKTTWNSDYTAVWHFENNLLDGTANSYDGTNNGSSNSTNGKIGDGRSFSGSDYIALGATFPNLNSNFSISGWIYTLDNSVAGQHVFCDDENNTGGYALSLGDPGTGRLRFYSRSMNTVSLDNSSNAISDSIWYHVAAVADISGQNRYIYVNGVQVAVDNTDTGTWGTDIGISSIGGETNNGETANRFDGLIDELRISNTVRSVDWLLTEYNNQNLPSTFYSLSAEIDLSATIVSSSDGDWDDVSRWTGSIVPGPGNIVTINHQIDIDANTGDIQVCSLTVSNQPGNDTRMRMQDGQILHIKGNVNVIAYQNNNDHVDFNLEDDSSKVIIDSNLTFDRSSINTRDRRLGLRMQDGTILTVGGDYTYNYGNSNETSDVIELRNEAILRIAGVFDGTLDDGNRFTIDMNNDAQFIIGTPSSNSNFTFDHNGGNDFRLEIDDDAVFTVNGDMTITQTGGLDERMRLNINNGTSAEMHVTGDLSMTHASGDDIDILLDDVNSVLNIGGNFLVDMQSGSGDNFTLNIDNGTMTVDSTMSLIRALDFDYINVDMDGGSLTADSLICTSGGTLSGSRYISMRIDGDATIDVATDLIVTMTSGDDFYIGININNGSTADLDILNDFIITRTDGDDIEFYIDDDNSRLHIGGDFNLTSTGGEQFILDLDKNATFDCDGNFLINHSAGQSGFFNLAGGTDLPLLNVDGNFTINNTNGGDDYDFNLDGGTFSVGGDFVLTLDNSADDIHLYVENAAIVDITGDYNATITSGDDIVLELGLNSGGSTASASIGGNMTLVHNGGSSGSSRMAFQIDDNCRGSVGGNLSLTANYNAGDDYYVELNNTAELDVNGNIVFSAQAAGECEIDLNATSILHIGGNFVRSAAPNDFGFIISEAGTTIEYDGTSAQIFADEDGAGSDGIDYELVVINNTFGTDPQLTMEAPVTLSNNITFTDGVLQTTATNVLSIADNATTNGGNLVSYVDGPVRKEGNDAFEFPVGNGGIWSRISMSAPFSTGTTFEGQYFRKNPNSDAYDTSSHQPTINNVSGLDYWIMDKITAGADSVLVTLHWEDAFTNRIDDLNDLKVVRWDSDSSKWIDQFQSATTGGVNAIDSGTITSNVRIQKFSPFTFGSGSSTSNPLPITLLEFKAESAGDVVNVFWTTIEEINNDYFTIERSVDSKNFYPVDQVDGAGNNSGKLSYSYIDDNPFVNRYSYYRLKQTDFDGTESYSKIDAVFMSKTPESKIVVFPNPVTIDQVFVNLPNSSDEVVEVFIFDQLGSQVKHTKIRSDSDGLLSVEVPVVDGMYILKILTSTSSYTSKILVN